MGVAVKKCHTFAEFLPDYLLLKGRLLFLEKKTDDALARVKEASEADSRSVEAQYALGLIYSEKQDIEEATKAFNAVLTLNPRVVAAQLELSRLHLSRGGAEAAVGFAEDAIKNQPENGDAHLVLARGLMARGDFA